MSPQRSSLKPIQGANRVLRRRSDIKRELALAVAPTLTVLIVLGLVETLTRQRLLFASLASSVFLIYLDPQHNTNRVRTLVTAQMMAASIGLLVDVLVGSGYVASAITMVTTIVLMIVLDIVHPPAVSTALSFSLRTGSESNLVLFGLAVGITVILVIIERVALWLLARHHNQ